MSITFFKIFTVGSQVKLMLGKKTLEGIKYSDIKKPLSAKNGKEKMSNGIGQGIELLTTLKRRLLGVRMIGLE